MKTTDWKHTSVGNIVAEDFAAAKVFKKYGIDFCCHGEVAQTVEQNTRSK